MKRIVFLTTLLVLALTVYAVGQAGLLNANDRATGTSNDYTIADTGKDSTEAVTPAEYTMFYLTASGDSVNAVARFYAGIVSGADIRVELVDTLLINAAGNYFARVESLLPYPDLFAEFEGLTDNGHETILSDVRWGLTGRLAGAVIE